MSYERLTYLDTGEIFETNADGSLFHLPVATLTVGPLDSGAHALGEAFAAAPQLLKAAIRALSVLEGVASIRRAGDAIEELEAAIAKAGGAA